MTEPGGERGGRTEPPATGPGRRPRRRPLTAADAPGGAPGPAGGAPGAAAEPTAPAGGAPGPPGGPTAPAGGLSIELPERGTGARAARRAAQAAAARRGDAARGVVVHQPPGRPDPGSPPTVALVPRRPGRRWMLGFATALLACVLVAAGLGAVGLETLRESRAGRTVTSAQPDEPGFEGFLAPTPTLAVRVVHEGGLQAAYVLSLGAGDLGGGVLLIPADTLIGSGDLGSLAVLQVFGGPDADLRGAIESVAGAGIDELVTIDDARWAELVAPVAPIRLVNPDEAEGFPAGPLELAPGDVGPFLRARADGERPLSALVRHELLWEAWLGQLAGAGTAAVPGELAAGLGRFVRGLAAGPHQVRSLPVTEVVNPDGGIEYAVDLEARSRLVVTLIPFPRGTANAPRTLVRLLDGTGDPGNVERVAPQVVASDSAIVVVGNADRFDYEGTQIRYHRPDQQAAAERLRDDLGAGEVIADVRPIDSFDVTIVLGTDL